MTKEEIILHFCKQYRDLGAENCFCSGMCYWFARIIAERFAQQEPEIVYDAIVNHFGCRLHTLNKVYDVTGDVTNQYNWEPFSEFVLKDLLHSERIINQCILKLPDRE